MRVNYVIGTGAAYSGEVGRFGVHADSSIPVPAQRLAPDAGPVGSVRVGLGDDLVNHRRAK
jgi:hypothetical protein